MSAIAKKVIVLGLDGLEPTIVERLLDRGELPHLARFAQSGGYRRIGTTWPAQTPVAWSSFATGTNPGGHGIYDFVRRNPQTYLPEPGLTRYQQKNSFLPPRPENLRRGTPFWDMLGQAGIASTVVRCPCTYPPEKINGRLISGMGVPCLQGGFGTPTFYTSATDAQPGESESLVHVEVDGNRIETHLLGPRDARSGSNLRLPIRIDIDSDNRTVRVNSSGKPRTLEVREGQWSDWLKVKFKLGLLQSVSGMVRFYLVRLGPVFELYASPINPDPDWPQFPITWPEDYSHDLEQQIGTYYTTGMVEDHTGLQNGRIDERAYLDQCHQVFRERERMMLHELQERDEGFFYCLFDTPDRVQHMFWRFRDADHPANRRHGDAGRDEYAQVIEEHYRQCDRTVGHVLEFVDDQTVCCVLSDHGFGSFRRGVHLNAWLHQHGLLSLKPGIEPGPDTEEFFGHVDWSRTKAYAVGLSSIFLNLKGREAEGIVDPDEAKSLMDEIGRGLCELQDDQFGVPAIRRVAPREDIYRGAYADESPDLVVGFHSGYRASWGTAMGGVASELFEDNTRKWSGDHIVDPALVPGVCFMNRPIHQEAPRLVDMAPTILQAFGLSPSDVMEGESLIS